MTYNSNLVRETIELFHKLQVRSERVGSTRLRSISLPPTPGGNEFRLFLLRSAKEQGGKIYIDGFLHGRREAMPVQHYLLSEEELKAVNQQLHGYHDER